MADNFEARKEETVEEVLKAGAGVSVSARYYVVEKLKSFARLAKSSDATLWLRDTDQFETFELVEIAKAGGKNVVMEIRTSSREPYRS